jgi:predicted amidohydrolase
MRRAVPVLERVTKWWPSEQAKPRFSKTKDGRLRLAANGTRACSGAWRLAYRGAVPGAWYEVSVDVGYEDLAHPREMLGALVRWQCEDGTPVLDELLRERTDPDTLRMRRLVQAPPGTTAMTVECFFRWSPAGASSWSPPAVRPAPAPTLKPARVCVVTGSLPRIHARRGHSIATNVEFYVDLCARAAEAMKPDLIALPEVAPQWRVPGSCFETAVPIPGPETAAFAAIAKKHRTYLALGVMERDGDAVFNSAVLLDRKGSVAGTYHKVHLASGSEWSSGILPGEGFPVFATDIGRIGFNICMDSSAAESARAVALNGADFLVLPIMGDHRADRWTTGPPVFSEDRWRAIMRVRALDNQLTMVVSRNEGQGSCIINRKGDFLAFNEGDQDFVWAEVPPRVPYREGDGYCFRDVNWVQRRPRLYGMFVDEDGWGNAQTLQTTGDDRGPIG